MTRPLRIQYPGAFYYITCRGNEQKNIFQDDVDRKRFLALLAESLETYQVVLYAYIMMDNHFHLVLQTIRANLSEFMRQFNICYTGWFNYRHGRCGKLYQGRYKAFLIDADNYLLELSRYVHLNPVRVAHLCECNYQQKWRYVQRYLWSSLPGYLNTRHINEFINYSLILNMIGGRHSYRSFVLEGLRKGIVSPFKYVKEQMVLGDDDFLARVKDEYVKDGFFREQPSYRGLVAKVIDPEIVLGCVVKFFEVEKKMIVRRRTRGYGVIRGIVAELLYKYSSLTEGAIGRLIGNIDYGAVYQLRRRLKERMKHDDVVRESYLRVESEIKKL